MHNDVVRRIETLPLKRRGNHRDRAIVFVPDDPPVHVLARELPALVVECVAVGETGRLTVLADMAVFWNQPHLPVIGNVAPHQELTRSAPSGPFGPKRSRP